MSKFLVGFGLLSIVALSGCVSGVPIGGACETDESCDAGSICDEAVCRALCSSGSACGPLEECFEGRCLPSECGNEAIGNDEECDDGRANSETGACRTNCRLSRCGDGAIGPAEQCDHGAANSDTVADACRTDCTQAACGDGTIDSSEACDDGNTLTDECAYGQSSCTVCGPACTQISGVAAYCGNGNIETKYGEACDDGNIETEPCVVGETSCVVCDGTCHETAGAASFCGDGYVDGRSPANEQCDQTSEGCVGCILQAGWDCTGACEPVVYRIALTDTGAGLLLRDFSIADGPTTIRTVSSGHNPESLWPDWSFDGALVAYPVGGTYLGQTYLYQPEATSGYIDAYQGTQPNFGYPPVKTISRHDDNYSIWDALSQSDSTVNMNGSAVRWPAWEPGSTARFAFIDTISGSPGTLSIFTGTSAFDVETSAQMYAWHPDGGEVAYVHGTGPCTIRRASVDTLAAGTPSSVATGVDCDARLAFSPDGERLAVGSGAKIFLIDATPVSVQNLTAGTGLEYTASGDIVDVDFSPDGDFIVFLRRASGSSGSSAVYLLEPGSNSPVSSGISCACEAMALSPVVVSP